MDNELKRLINGLIDDATCYLCGMAINIDMDDLNRNSDELYVTDYYCPGCDVGYNIQVEDEENWLSFSADRKDIDRDDTDLPEISRKSRKEALQKQTHPVKDLVEGLEEMINALSILHQNRNRIQDACNTVRDEGFEQDAEFDKRVTTDLHNYMASAYSFEEILDTVEPNLPTDGPVESAKTIFDEENQVIKGLRTYAQHHLSLQHSFSQFIDRNTGQTEVTITVSMDDVGEDEVEDFEYQDPDISYEKVDGDTINIERRIDLHYEAAKDLVEQVFQYAESTHEDELEEYHEATSYSLKEGD